MPYTFLLRRIGAVAVPLLKGPRLLQKLRPRLLALRRLAWRRLSMLLQLLSYACFPLARLRGPAVRQRPFRLLGYRNAQKAAVRRRLIVALPRPDVRFRLVTPAWLLTQPALLGPGPRP